MSEDGSTNSGGTRDHNQNGDKSLYHWVYVAGFCIFSAFVDFTFLWPENHLLALLALAAILSLVLIYELRVIGTPLTWITMFVAALFMIAGGIFWITGPNVSPDVEASGEGFLIPGHDPTPSNECDGVRKKPENIGYDFTVIVGSVTVLTGRRMPLTVLEICNQHVLTVKPEERGLLIDADDWDEKGQSLFSVRDNKYKAAEGTYSYMTRSPDRSKITVFDRWGDELLMLRYLNKTTLAVRGFLGCKGTKKRIRITDSAIEDKDSQFLVRRMCASGYFTKAAIVLN